MHWSQKTCPHVVEAAGLIRSKQITHSNLSCEGNKKVGSNKEEEEERENEKKKKLTGCVSLVVDVAEAVVVWIVEV